MLTLLGFGIYRTILWIAVLVIMSIVEPRAADSGVRPELSPQFDNRRQELSPSRGSYYLAVVEQLPGALVRDVRTQVSASSIMGFSICQSGHSSSAHAIDDVKKMTA